MSQHVSGRFRSAQTFEIQARWQGSTHLRERERELRVRAPLRAALERLELLRRRDAVRACRDSARCDAPERPSRFKVRVVARDRFADGRFRFEDRCLRLCFRAEAVPVGGGGNFTPAFLAFERPIAIACFAFFTPCFPSLT